MACCNSLAPSYQAPLLQVKHPERYTLYTLDEPLVVGGGLGQLGAESQAQLQQQVRNACVMGSA